MKNRLKNQVEYRPPSRIDFWTIFLQFLEQKSIQNRSRSGFGRALDEDSDSKLKKERARFIGGAQTGEFWGLWGEGNREGANVTTRRNTFGQAKGSADYEFRIMI